MINEEFRVSLNVQGREAVRQTTADLRAMKAATEDTYEVLAAPGAKTPLEGYAVAASKADQEWDRLTGSITATTTATSRATAEADKYAGASHRAGVNAGRMGQGVNALAQGMQDMQYGFTAGLNNLSNAAMLFGAGGGIVAAVTIAGVAIQQLYNNWGGLMEWIGVTSRKEIPPSTDLLKNLEEQIGKNSKALDDLRDRQRLTSDEMNKYNRLLENQTVLERILATEKERRAAVDKLKKIEPVDDKAAPAAAVVEGIKAVGGEAAIKQIAAAVAKDPKMQARFAPGGTPTEAAESILRQAADGSPTVIAALQGLAGRSKFGRALRAASPEQQARAAAAEEAAKKGEIDVRKAAREEEEEAKKAAEKAADDEQWSRKIAAAEHKAEQDAAAQERGREGFRGTKADILQMAGFDALSPDDVSDEDAADLMQMMAQQQESQRQQQQFAVEIAKAIAQQQQQQAAMWARLAGQQQQQQQRQQVRGFTFQPTFNGGF